MWLTSGDSRVRVPLALRAAVCRRRGGLLSRPGAPAECPLPHRELPLKSSSHGCIASSFGSYLLFVKLWRKANSAPNVHHLKLRTVIIRVRFARFLHPLFFFPPLSFSSTKWPDDPSFARQYQTHQINKGVLFWKVSLTCKKLPSNACFCTVKCLRLVIFLSVFFGH